jgi:hypothetical protein
MKVGPCQRSLGGKRDRFKACCKQEVRLVTVHSKRPGKLFDRRTGKAEFKSSIGADFLNWDITR